MINLIIQSNKWYDNLSEIKRLLFFLVIIMGSLIYSQYLSYVENTIWAFPIWAIVVLIWRGVPILFPNR